MTLSVQIILAGCVILIFGVLGILLLTPTSKSKKRPLPKDPAAKILSSEETQGKDWQETSLKLERHILGLRKEIEDYQRKEKALEREVTVQKGKYNKLQEKLAQERDWQKKEEDDLEKRAKEISSLKTELKEYEAELEKSHTERLRFERERREVKDSLDSLDLVTEARRILELQIAKLQAEGESFRKEIRELKQQNAKLSEKKEGEEWVAKTEFEKLQVELWNKEKDLLKLKEQLKKEVL